MRKRLSGALVLAAVIVGAACGESGRAPAEAPPGAEGSRCYPNDTCDSGLSCLSGRCVKLPVQEGDSGSGGVVATSGGTTSAGGTLEGGSGGSGGTTASGGTVGSGGLLASGGALGSDGGGSTGGAGGVSPIGPQRIDRTTDPERFQGATGPGSLRFLYPYDRTVFPRGLPAPVVMWEGGTAEAVLLEVTSAQFVYRETFPATSPLRLTVSQDAWDAAGAWSGGAADPATITLTVLSGGQVNAISEQVIFAGASMAGAIYYNTYDSPLAAYNGAVMKTLPSAASPSVFLAEAGAPPLGPCISCHAISANGSTMTANRHLYPGAYESRGYGLGSGSPQQVSAGIPEAGFAAIYPDGSRMITNGPPNPSTSIFFPSAPGNVASLTAATSRMMGLTGAPISAPGWDGVVPHAQMPMFSPLGDRIVYNDHDKGGGHSLWVADFEPRSNTFSNHRQIYNDPQLLPAWPFFTPDGAQVVFTAGTNPEYVSQVPGDFGPPAMKPLGRGHLRIVDVATGQGAALDAANGRNGSTVYLPANDPDFEYFPSVSPVARGGYYWALFTSRRAVGNMWSLPPENPKAKKIWVTAISIGGAPGTDPSHPAFLLPGQEIESGNSRAVSVLEPCRVDDSPCSGGTDCCGGFCVDAGAGNPVCGPRPTSACSRLDDKCDVDADCCAGADNGAAGGALRCLGGYCGQVGY